MFTIKHKKIKLTAFGKYALTFLSELFMVVVGIAKEPKHITALLIALLIIALATAIFFFFNILIDGRNDVTKELEDVTKERNDKAVEIRSLEASLETQVSLLNKEIDKKNGSITSLEDQLMLAQSNYSTASAKLSILHNNSLATNVKADYNVGDQTSKVNSVRINNQSSLAANKEDTF